MNSITRSKDIVATSTLDKIKDEVRDKLIKGRDLLL